MTDGERRTTGGRELVAVQNDPSGRGRRVRLSFAVSETDWSDRGPRTLLDVQPYECRVHMLRTDRWKYILHERFRPQLFDMENDPDELVDLGAEPVYEPVRRDLHERLFT